MNKPRLALLALTLTTLPLASSAQTVVYTPWSPPPALIVVQPPPPPEALVAADLRAPADQTRVRFGVSGNLTFGLANDHGHGVDTGVFAPGLTLDLGAQFNRSTAVYLRASGASLLLVNQASVFGVVEYSPADWLSLGTGVGWTGMASAFTGNRGCCGPSFRNTWGGIAVPAIVGFNLGSRNEATGRLRGTRVGLEAALGMEPGSGALGWHAAVSIGYVTM